MHGACVCVCKGGSACVCAHSVPLPLSLHSIPCVPSVTAAPAIQQDMQDSYIFKNEKYAHLRK